MPKKTPLLTTGRLTLRPFEEGDMEDALAIFYCDEVRATYMLPDFPDRSAAEALFARIRAVSLLPRRINYAIALNGRLIGFINDCGIDSESAELGYVIHPAHWGQGYATEALRAVIDELFRMGLRRVCAAHFAENTASARVMQKAGMRLSGQEETIEYRGAPRRCIYYEITNDPK
ncbi:MAG: GNAT family N-acetyltransferase [Eubacteriales bacterium]|nr:GNAT family N-acetyltransferase [Eubacteriales bacterium]